MIAGKTASKAGKPSAAGKSSKPKVIIYSTQLCPWCHRAKEFLEENNIDYVEIDVSSDQKKAEEMIKKSGQMGVPVLDINGQIVVGFDVDRIRKLLNLP